MNFKTKIYVSYKIYDKKQTTRVFGFYIHTALQITLTGIFDASLLLLALAYLCERGLLWFN